MCRYQLFHSGTSPHYILKLDTMTGQLWLIYTTYKYEEKCSEPKIGTNILAIDTNIKCDECDENTNGRFTLCFYECFQNKIPSSHFETDIVLLDQNDGRCWKVSIHDYTGNNRCIETEMIRIC